MMIKIDKVPDTRVCQGDILRDIEYLESMREVEGEIEIRKIIYPYAIVLTQDCDLAQDYTFRHEEKETKDKLIVSVLMAPMHNAEHVFVGEHLNELGITSQRIKKNGSHGKLIMQNQLPRYHYLAFPDDVPIVPLIIDFKHYFSAPVPYLNSIKGSNFECKVSDLFREDVSQRFAAFLSRIGLPDI